LCNNLIFIGHPVVDGNYTHGSQWFESGFPGLTITSLDGVGRLLLNGAFISWLSADASRIGGRKGKK
jgi:hypothetical protein